MVIVELKGKRHEKNWFEAVFLRTWRPYIWIFIIGLLVYLKTLSFGFVDYDDRHLIVTNHNFLSELSNIFKTFTQDVFHVPFHNSSKSYYRPLLTVSLMLDTQLGGTSPIVYHLSNIIIHLIASCLLFLFLIKLKYRKEPVLFFSFMFTVHPALTQAIAWIPGRNDSLLAVFTLLSFVYFLNLLERKNWRYFFLHMLFFAMALFTKETALALIPVCIFYLYFSQKEKILSSKKIGITAGWFLIALSWFLLRKTSIENPDITVFFIMKSLLFNLPGIIQYSGKILFPFNLSVYPIMKDGNFFYGIVAIILLLTALFLSKRKSIESVIFGSSWFILFLVPSLIGSNPGAQTKLLEHRIYLPIIGVIILLLETDLIKKLDYKKNTIIIPFFFILMVFSLLTFTHSNTMQNEMTFWGNAVSTSPHSSVAHLNLGDKYYSRRLLQKAELEFRKALELNPVQKFAHNNLGRIYANKQMFEKAEYEFREELRINPGYDNATYNLGMLKSEQGNLKEAVYFWKETLKINLFHIKANNYMAIYYYNQGNPAQAKYHVEQLQKRGIKINTDFFRGSN